MKQERKAQLLTIAALALALGIAVGRKQLFPDAARSSAPNAQDAIYGMLDAARAGDVAAYLESYAGKMRSAIEQSVSETGTDRFSRYLKDSNSAIKGVAVYDPEPVSVREMRVRLEYVYQDRNETQTYYLENVDGNWKITRIDGSERANTLIPYGTPVQ
jgi:hypothetical protein